MHVHCVCTACALHVHGMMSTDIYVYMHMYAQAWARDLLLLCDGAPRAAAPSLGTLVALGSEVLDRLPQETTY